jgi:ribosomal protein S18 acetylase RimI-like enzyme
MQPIDHWEFTQPEMASRTRVPIWYITMLGVHFDYQGLPDGPGDTRYSVQIVDHLLEEASRSQQVPRLYAGLSVHPENVKAIRLYQSFGFEWLTDQGGFSRMFVRL